MTPKPGWQTSEGQMALLQAIVAAAIALCAAMGWGVPSYLSDDSSWITAAALGFGTVVTLVHSFNRTSLKKTLAQAEKIVVQGAQGEPGPQGPQGPPGPAA